MGSSRWALVVFLRNNVRRSVNEHLNLHFFTLGLAFVLSGNAVQDGTWLKDYELYAHLRAKKKLAGTTSPLVMSVDSSSRITSHFPVS